MILRNPFGLLGKNSCNVKSSRLICFILMAAPGLDEEVIKNKRILPTKRNVFVQKKYLFPPFTSATSRLLEYELIVYIKKQPIRALNYSYPGDDYLC